MTTLVQSKLFAAIPGLFHAFGTASEPVPLSFKSVWERDRPKWRQVHGTRIAEVSGASQECGEADGLFTFKGGLPVGVITADCVPVLAARKDGKAVAAIHAGWRGTRAGIVSEFANLLQSRGEALSNWVASIGPAIGPCCYEVSPELAADFSQTFGSGFVSGRKLDLPAINASQLSAFGEVEVLQLCTRCDSRFFSHRRSVQDGTPEGRQFSIICS